MNKPTPARDPARLAIALAAGTIAWNVLEGGVSVGFGLAEESVALLGFGLDSWIEVASAGVVLWRLRGETGRGAGPSRDRERRATKIISALFLALAATAAGGAVLQLGAGARPETTLPGLVISAVSLSFMFALWRAKLRVAEALDSRTLQMDAACSRACIELSGVLLAGSLLFLLHPALWWADAVAALGIALLIGREGLEGWRAANRPEFTGGCCGCGH
ncbi:MAG: cation transporter [Alphaproteobacteria bacterium]|nr:cation transporter [Alphaproteobacteria bacterium]